MYGVRFENIVSGIFVQIPITRRWMHPQQWKRLRWLH